VRWNGEKRVDPRTYSREFERKERKEGQHVEGSKRRKRLRNWEFVSFARRTDAR